MILTPAEILNTGNFGERYSLTDLCRMKVAENAVDEVSESVKVMWFPLSLSSAARPLRRGVGVKRGESCGLCFV